MYYFPNDCLCRLEIEHYYKIVRALEFYASWQFKRLQNKHQDYLMLPPKFQSIASFIPNKFKKMRRAIIQNQAFLTLIVQQASNFMIGTKGYDMSPDFISIHPEQIPSLLNMDKVESLHCVILAHCDLSDSNDWNH